MNYQIGNVSIDSHTREIHVSGLQKHLRPKTTEVLLYLLRSRERIVSKDELLRSIWHDVVTQEYVLYQSINEIRSFFPNEQVVRTFPRQGYQWIAATEESLPSEHLCVARTAFGIPYAGIALLLLVLTPFVIYSPGAQKILSILFAPSLPATAITEEHTLILYPLVDTTSSADGNTGVFSSDETEELAEYLKLIPAVILQSALPAQQQNEPVVPLAEITATSYPEAAADTFSLHTRLYRQMDEYRLHYVLLSTSSIWRGVIFSNSADASFSELASNLGQFIGGNPNTQDALADEALFLGMEAFVQQNYAYAETLLHTAAILKPEALTSWRYLSKSQIFQGKFGLASETIREVLNTTTFAPRNGFEMQVLNQLKAIANPVPAPQVSQTTDGTA